MIRRGVGRGRPGLLGTVARTAVVAGTATAVSGRVQQGQAATARTQAEAAAHRDQQAPPPPAPAAPVPAAEGGLVEELTKLAARQQAGVLTAEEFAATKARLLSA